MRDAEIPSLDRGLIVIADGVHAAFASGVVAELARGGAVWTVGFGAGLGAQIAALALLGDAGEAERRWLRQGESGGGLFASRLAMVQAGIGIDSGIVILPDPWRLDGWLDPRPLVEHLAPEAAGLPGRIAAAACQLWVAIDDLKTNQRAWRSIQDADPATAATLLTSAASFPGGWGPVEQGGERLWGGAAAAIGLPVPATAVRVWDIVVGAPVPSLARPGLGRSLIEQVQRRDEQYAAACALDVAAAVAGEVRVLAPGEQSWRDFAKRDTADCGIEYPLAWERNGELTGVLVRFGSFVAARIPRATTT